MLPTGLKPGMRTTRGSANVLSSLTNAPLKRAIADSRERLYRVALAWCGDQMLADDLAQEALAAALEHCHKLRDSERMNAWLFAILHNCWNRHLRRRRPTQEFTDEFPAQEPGPYGDCVSLEAVQLVRSVVASLPVEQRQVISLVELEGLSYCEVARALDIPIGTVMSRLYRARKALVSRFNERRQAASRPSAQLHRVK